jgi:hypothetical protein
MEREACEYRQAICLKPKYFTIVKKKAIQNKITLHLIQ